jgi:hypothetical protein
MSPFFMSWGRDGLKRKPLVILLTKSADNSRPWNFQKAPRVSKKGPLVGEKAPLIVKHLPLAERAVPRS